MGNASVSFSSIESDKLYFLSDVKHTILDLQLQCTRKESTQPQAHRFLDRQTSRQQGSNAKNKNNLVSIDCIGNR
eukprot:scaffold7077_cov122-Skeletonema_dohrnii-CCMP3373.AAC.2